MFDSGVGGLTVLRSLQQHLPDESFIYLGDTARLPYGTKSPETIIRYAIQASDLLRKRGIKLLVIACNTASTLALEALQQHITDIPVIGVLEPGAHAAVKHSKTGNIAVIGTEATVRAGGYEASIKKHRADANVVSLACSLFVALAEEGWTSGPIAESIVEAYLRPILNNKDHNPDCLVLGCTHFPALYDTIKKVINSHKITIIDSAVATSNEVESLFQQGQVHVNGSQAISTQYLVTDSPQRFVAVAKQFLNRELVLDDIELVDFHH